jgi:hypothetical protein
MRHARGDAGLTDETRFVKGRAGDGVLRQALSLKLSNDQSKKSGSPEGPTLNRRSSENDRYEMKFGPISHKIAKNQDILKPIVQPIVARRTQGRKSPTIEAFEFTCNFARTARKRAY